MDELLLVEPSLEYKDEIWAFREEVLQKDAAHGDKFAGCNGLELAESAEDWISHCVKLKSPFSCEETGSYVAEHIYLAVRRDDDKVAGIIGLRPDLKAHPVLNLWGGNIGFSVRPSMRGHGYSKMMLALVLEKAKADGLPKVMVCCDDDNYASEKAIVRNGGIYEKTVEYKGYYIKRYWICLEG